MRVREILTQERTQNGVQASSKKQLLDQIAQLAAASCEGLIEQGVFDALVAREKLGSTGLGEGIAIPHCRLAECEKPIGLLLKLDTAIDFDAIDNRAVDLVFVLLVPQENPEQHLKILSHLASLFSDTDFQDALRDSGDAEHLYHQAIESEVELRLAS